VSVFGGNEFDTMVLEEMGRLVSIREGETIEKTSLMRAATRAIGLKAAKGDVKAYTAVSAKFAAVENRRRAQQEELLRAVTEYKQRATQELTPRPRRAFECPVGLGPFDRDVRHRRLSCDPTRSPVVTLPEQEHANVFRTKIVLVPTTSMQNGWRQDAEVVVWPAAWPRGPFPLRKFQTVRPAN
jgi:hypothetical protein